MNLRDVEGTLPRLSDAEAADLATQIDPGWAIGERDGVPSISRSFKFPDFAAALAFVNAVGAIAESEDHHPEIALGWGHVEVELWTHVSGGITLSDLVVAAKIDRLPA